MSFARVYPLYVAKAKRKGRTKAEVDQVIRWLTGYTQKGLEVQLAKQADIAAFIAKAPRLNPSRALITGVICGVRVEDIKEPTMREIRYMDKLIDELANGKAMEKILRGDRGGTVAASSTDISAYNRTQKAGWKEICSRLATIVYKELPKAESKIWHASPVWFLDSNPIVGYSVLKSGVRLMFWSGGSFKEDALEPVGNAEKFKAAGVLYTDVGQIKVTDLKRWIKKSKTIQWDYKNIVKRRGKLVKIGSW